MQALHEDADFLEENYYYQKIEKLNKEEAAKICPSPAYHGGYVHIGAFHLHPLRFALGLARAAKIAGVLVYENSEVLSIEQGTKHKVSIRRGTVLSEHVVLACNGYIGNLSATISRHVMPINNFVVATEPLGVTLSEVLTKDIAVTDTKFVVNYFRKSHDGRLLFGGGENYNYKFS